jgi:hypothetical protein
VTHVLACAPVCFVDPRMVLDKQRWASGGGSVEALEQEGHVVTVKVSASGSVKEPAYKTLIRTPYDQISKALYDPYRRVGLAEPLRWALSSLSLLARPQALLARPRPLIARPQLSLQLTGSIDQLTSGPACMSCSCCCF